MQEFAELTNMSTNPHKMLIQSMFGDEVLLITPLPTWYRKKGLVVTDVQQVVQFDKEKCFESYVENVDYIGREADIKCTFQLKFANSC